MTSVLAALIPLLDRVPVPLPRRQRRLTGRHARVDGIPYVMPVNSDDSPVLMVAFPISRRAAAAILPGSEIHPLDIGFGRSLLVVTVVDYRSTDIGRYIEYSLALAVTHGPRPAPPVLPLLLQRTLKFGQYVVDLPVSTEISVKGGKGIWGMPKHQASLDFVVTDTTVSAQYDHDGALACLVEIDRPAPLGLPLRMAAVNYCAFRGMLMKSTVYFDALADIAVGRRARARLVLGDAPAVAPLRTLQIRSKPLFTAYLPRAVGFLDDHYEGWFLTAETADEAATAATGEGLDSVVDLGRGEEWPPPPARSAAMTAGSV